MNSVPVISGLRLVARSSSRIELLVALNAWLAAVRASPGCIKATIAESIANPAVLYAVIEWASEADLKTFSASQRAKDLAHPMFALLAEKVQTTRFRADEIPTTPEEELFSL